MDEKNELQSMEDIATLLVNETDPDKTKRLINLFNLNFAKKNALKSKSTSHISKCDISSQHNKYNPKSAIIILILTLFLSLCLIKTAIIGTKRT